MNGLDFGTAIGLIKGLNSPNPAVIESAVSDWLDDHPEATTTVQDGSITKAKLDSNLQGTVDDVADLKSQIDNMSQPDWNQSDSSANGFIKNKPAIRQQANGGILENAATSASGQNSHAEGGGTTASGNYSHAEGSGAEATGNYSHAEGGGTTASGAYSHAEGGNTIASGDYSHAEGSNTTANHTAQHVFGMHNVPDSSAESSGARGNYIEIVGNGLDTNRRSNARTLDWEGNQEVAGDVIAYGCGGVNSISLADLKSHLEQFYDKFTDEGLWSLGTISASTGNNDVAITRMRTNYLQSNIVVVIPKSGYKIRVVAYDSSETHIGEWNGSAFAKSQVWLTSNISIKELNSSYKYRIVAAKADDSSLTVSTDATGIEFWAVTDSSLSVEGAAADAKKTGDLLVPSYNEVFGTSRTDILSTLSWTDKYFINISGVPTSNNNFKYSAPISVNEGEEYEYELHGVNNTTAVIAAYDSSDNYIVGKSVYYDSSHSSGARVIFSGIYKVPSGVAKLAFTFYKASASINDKINKLGIYSKVQKNTDDIAELQEEIGVTNPWNGLRVSAFGTSLTDTGNSPNAVDPNGDPTGKYLAYLIEMGGFAELAPIPSSVSSLDESKSQNFGIAGGSINGQILYYIRYFLHTGKNGTYGNKAELVTIEGSVNDYASSVPLGEVGDTVPYTHSLLPDSSADGTFAGACYCAFTEAQTYAEDALVVFLTDSTGKLYSANGNNYNQLRKNSLGLYQKDYIDMAVAVAKFVGIPVIECGSESMINAQNPDYLVDWIHHTYLGGYQYAKAIWSRLKMMPPKVTELPND